MPIQPTESKGDSAMDNRRRKPMGGQKPFTRFDEAGWLLSRVQRGQEKCPIRAMALHLSQLLGCKRLIGTLDLGLIGFGQCSQSLALRQEHRKLFGKLSRRNGHQELPVCCRHANAACVMDTS